MSKACQARQSIYDSLKTSPNKTTNYTGTLTVLNKTPENFIKINTLNGTPKTVS